MLVQTKRLEKTYGKLFTYMLMVINPFKKVVFDTQCIVHKYINAHALEILKNDKYEDAYSFFSDYLPQLNDGVVWADQDFKSIGHFYNAHKKRGLYGHMNAMGLATEYYEKALSNWKNNDVYGAMFFLGAAIHLVQDMSVPQHANIKLFDSHRQYETFMKKTYLYTPEFTVSSGGCYYETIDEFIKNNARMAMKIYHRFNFIKDENEKFHAISRYTLPLALKTTAGCLLMFYMKVSKGV